MMTRQNDIPLNEANNNNNNDVDGKASADGENQAESSSSSKPSESSSMATTAPTTSEDGAKVPALIPLWDVANHSNGIITTNFNPIDGQIEGATMTDVKKDEQIFIYYGNRNNANLLIHNGYVYAVCEPPLFCLDFAISQINLIRFFFCFFLILFVLQFCHGKQSIGQCGDSFGFESIRSIGETTYSIAGKYWNSNA